jgi:hypothetical protein
MAPKEPRDKDQFASRSETGLILVSDRTVSWEWDTYPRREPKPARERLGPLKSRSAVAKR